MLHPSPQCVYPLWPTVLLSCCGEFYKQTTRFFLSAKGNYDFAKTEEGGEGKPASAPTPDATPAAPLVTVTITPPGFCLRCSSFDYFVYRLSWSTLVLVTVMCDVSQRLRLHQSPPQLLRPQSLPQLSRPQSLLQLSRPQSLVRNLRDVVFRYSSFRFLRAGLCSYHVACLIRMVWSCDS